MSNDPWIDIDAAKLPDQTIGEGLCDLAITYCRSRDPNVRPAHVKARLLNDGLIVGKAYTAASKGWPDYDDPGSKWPPISRYGDWERLCFEWGVGFYRRLAKARQFTLHPDIVERNAVAFGSALASLMRPLGNWALLAGQSERSPWIEAGGPKDNLLLEPASGRPRNV